MKRLAFIIPAIVAMLGVAATAQAQNPHFQSCGASGVNSDGSLDASFRISGLGDNQSLTVTATADANATYACRNNGQQCPNAANKVNVSGTVSASGTFTSGKNGTIRGSLAVEPPPTDLKCPGGQKLVLVAVSYTNVRVSAPGAADCDPSPATFSANFFPNCP